MKKEKNWWLKKDCTKCKAYGPECPYVERNEEKKRGCSLFQEKTA